MTNFIARVRGLYGGTSLWTYGFKFTANTDVNTAAVTLKNATQSFWNVAVNGYKIYTTTAVATTDVIAYACNANWRTTAKNKQLLVVTGTDANPSLSFDTCCNHMLFGAEDNGTDRGHIALPTPAVDALVAQKWSAAFLASQQIIWAQFWTDMSALTAFQVVVYNRHVNKLGDPPFTNHLIADSQTSDKPGTQRRRQRKVIPVYGAAIPIP